MLCTMDSHRVRLVSRVWVSGVVCHGRSASHNTSQRLSFPPSSRSVLPLTATTNFICLVVTTYGAPGKIHPVSSLVLGSRRFGVRVATHITCRCSLSSAHGANIRPVCVVCPGTIISTLRYSAQGSFFVTIVSPGSGIGIASCGLSPAVTPRCLGLTDGMQICRCDRAITPAGELSSRHTVHASHGFHFAPTSFVWP